MNRKGSAEVVFVGAILSAFMVFVFVGAMWPIVAK